MKMSYEIKERLKFFLAIMIILTSDLFLLDLKDIIKIILLI